MPTAPKPIFKIIYLGKDITKDISSSLLSITYNDLVIGATDEIEISLEDKDALWRGPWYPQKKDRLKLQIGYDDLSVDCGEFEVDQIELTGPPDVVTLRGLATWVTSAMRTRASSTHDGKTLKQIAEFIAQKHGYTVEGVFFTIRLELCVQNRETDLAFLQRLSNEYGYVFSVRGTVLVFTSVYDLDGGKPVYTLDRSDLINYSIRDNTIGTFTSAQIKYHNPEKKKIESGSISFEQVDLNKGNGTGPTKSIDVLELRTKSENPQQSEAKAKAGVYNANSRQVEGSLMVQGYPLLVAGNNFELTGLGQISGKYHILQSTHEYRKGQGYTTRLSFKRVVGGSESDQKKSKSKKKQPIEIVKL